MATKRAKRNNHTSLSKKKTAVNSSSTVCHARSKKDERSRPVPSSTHPPEKVSTLTKPSRNKNTGPRYTFSTEIPEKYNETYICALPRDPDWLFVYWEFAPGTEETIKDEAEKIGSKLVLRVKDSDEPDLNEPAQPGLDIEIENNCTEWYIQIPQPGRRYEIAYGHKTSDGEFIPISQTEPVVTPPVQPITSFESGVPELRNELIDYSGEKTVLEELNRHRNKKTCPEKAPGQDSRYLGSASPD